MIALLRFAALCGLLCSLVLAEEPSVPGLETESEAEAAPPAAHAHIFTPGELRIYHYEALQQVVQQNLDDELEFESLLRWRFALRCAAVDETGADLVATIFLVQASNDGPGSHHAIDSSKAEAAEPDPLLGHLLRLNGRSLSIRIENGQVLRVDGSKELIAAMAGSGVDADRRRQVAERSYGPEALRAFWQAVLLQPASADEDIDLPQPLVGKARRSWREGAWKLLGSGEATAALATRPAPLHATISQLKGSGSVQINAEGILQRSAGTLNYRCDWLALGQNASQQHTLRWQLLLVDYKAAP